MVPVTFQQKSAKFVKEFEEENNVILQYARNEQNQRVGVTLAFRDPNTNKIRTGWSKCHTGKDVFNKEVGVYIAIQRAFDDTPPDFADHPCLEEVADAYESITDRAKRYFKD